MSFKAFVKSCKLGAFLLYCSKLRSGIAMAVAHIDSLTHEAPYTSGAAEKKKKKCVNLDPAYSGSFSISFPTNRKNGIPRNPWNVLQFSAFGWCLICPHWQPHWASTTNEKWVEFMSPNVDFCSAFMLTQVFMSSANSWEFSTLALLNFLFSLCGTPIKLVRAVYFVLLAS